MATVQLADVFLPEVYGTYGEVVDPILLAILEMGVLRADPYLNAFSEGASQVGTVPYWNDLDSASEPNASTDDPDDIAVPQKITSGTWTVRKAELNNGWSTMDLSRELALADPMPAIKQRTSRYWNRQKQKRLLAVALGVMNDSVASHASDMVIDLHLASGTDVTDDNLFSSDAAIDAMFTSGDHWQNIRALAVHSVIAKRMVKQNLIEQTPIGDGASTIPTYLGKPVITDDSMPVETINALPVYTSIFFGPGAIGFGEGTPTTPAEVERAPSRGNGGGMETFWERKTWTMHPMGYAWEESGDTGNAMLNGQPMIANLQNANRWTRKVDRKLIPMAFVKTNG